MYTHICVRLYCHRPGTLYMSCMGHGRLLINQSIDRHKIHLLFHLRSIFQVFVCSSCQALAALGIGSSLPFCTEKRSTLHHESEVPLLLCLESNRSSTIPQPIYSDLRTVAIIRYSDLRTVAINIYRPTWPVPISGVAISFSVRPYL